MTRIDDMAPEYYDVQDMMRLYGVKSLVTLKKRMMAIPGRQPQPISANPLRYRSTEVLDHLAREKYKVG